MATAGSPRYAFKTKMAEAREKEFQQVLLFGPSGVGKTTFLGSAGFDPRTAPMLLLDFDGGGKSVRGLDPTQMDVFPVRTWQDYNDAYEYLASPDNHYRSAAIDSTSETHVYAILDIVEEAVAAAYEADPKNPKRVDDTKVQQDDYGKAMTMMRRFLREFRKLKVHTFYTALMKMENEPRVGMVKKPALFGQMAEEVVGMFPVATYLTTADFGTDKKPDIGRALVLNNNPSIRAKVRTPWMVESPDMIRIGRDNGVTLLFDILKEPMPIEE